MAAFDLETLPEIAGYLRKSVRTVERWHKQRSLPVHVVNGRAYAIKRELDQWFREQSGAIPAALDDRPDDFRKVFGPDPTIHLVYSDLTLNKEVPKIIDAYELLLKNKNCRPRVAVGHLRKTLKSKPLVTFDSKGDHGRDGYHFRAEHSACVCEVRAAAYLAAELSQYKSIAWPLVSSSEIAGDQDLSFVSFGTLINSKTRDLLTNRAAFVDFRQGRFMLKPLEGERRYRQSYFLHPPVDDSSKFDYGLIIRIHPADCTVKKERAWIACAGVRQRGTSAAARVLANWRSWIAELKQNTGSFVGLVKISTGTDKKDDAANLEWIVESREGILAQLSKS
jgi:hypothetical protein